MDKKFKTSLLFQKKYWSPIFLQSSLVCERVPPCRQFSLQSTSMMFLNVANFIVIRM